MPTVGIKKIRYEDSPQTLTDTVNKNFQILEWLLGGKLNGTNLNEDYLENFIANHVQAGDILITKGTNARVVLNESQIAMQVSPDGGTTWVSKVYFDSITGQYIFDGVLSADVINALSAIITPNLYAEKATIAEITVDQLDTSDKVAKYLSFDASDVNYVKIYDQNVEFITATTDGLESEQATNRLGQLLYWIDDTHEVASTEVTDYPVMIFKYNELTKRQISFKNDGTNYVPVDAWGAGTGSGDNDKLFLYKPANKAVLEYFHSITGSRSAVEFSDFVDANLRRLKNCTINKTTQKISVMMEGLEVTEIIDYTEDPTSMTFTWPDGFVCTIEIEGGS